MAQNVSSDYRTIVYNGEKIYSCNLTIDGEPVSPSQIKEIKIYRPIIDTSKSYFYLGTFIADSIDITFKNISEFNIESGLEVELSVSLLVNGTLEPVNVGSFLIDNLEENYQKTNKISCVDYSIKFEPAVNEDYQNVMEYDEETGTYSITLEELLQWLCLHYDIELGSYPNINRDVKTGNWDSTLSGKQYISWIAEMMGGNAKIGRDKRLNIIPLNTTPVYTINALRSQSWELGEKYRISGVTYFDGVRMYPYGDDTYNTLIIRQDNLFVPSGDENNENEAIENIYDSVVGFEIYSLNNVNFGDLSLDGYDILAFDLNGTTYKTINHSELTYNGAIKTRIFPNIPTKQQEVTTNIIKPNELANTRKVYSEIDSLKGQIRLVAEATRQLDEQTQSEYGYILNQFENYTLESETAQLQTRVEEILTDSYANFATVAQLSDYSVTKLLTENVKIDFNGVSIYKTDIPDIDDAQAIIISDTKTVLNENGTKVSKIENGQVGKTITYNGYVPQNSDEFTEYRGQTINYSENIIVDTYAVFGNHSRMEDYVDNNNNEGTGMFWIGE